MGFPLHVGLEVVPQGYDELIQPPVQVLVHFKDCLCITHCSCTPASEVSSISAFTKPPLPKLLEDS